MGWRSQGFTELNDKGLMSWSVDHGNGEFQDSTEEFQGKTFFIEGLNWIMYGCSRNMYFRGNFDGILSAEEVEAALKPISEFAVYSGKYGGETFVGANEFTVYHYNGSTYFWWKGAELPTFLKDNFDIS